MTIKYVNMEKALSSDLCFQMIVSSIAMSGID